MTLDNLLPKYDHTGGGTKQKLHIAKFKKMTQQIRKENRFSENGIGEEIASLTRLLH